ncbi:MAG: redoxin domain-containing protein [Thermodesulfovibrionia bacterium]|nr:redoxin domain-containing protein [Thermodesulfovibrionia bacterium]
MHNITKQCRVSSNFFLLLLLLAFFITECIWPAHASALLSIKEGDRPKQFMLDDLNGNTVDVTRFFGNKPVILVFWKLMKNKAFLDYSLDELLFLQNFYEKYHDKAGLSIFGIYTPEEDKHIPGSELATVHNLISSNRITFPILIDRGFRIFQEYGVIALPTTIMIDKAGTIKFIYPSFPIAAHELLSEHIMDLIGMSRGVHKRERITRKKLDSHAQRLYHYALQMYKKGLLEQALSPLKKSLDLYPDHPWSHNLMGIIFWKRGKLEDSEDEFKRAIELDKHNIAAHLNYTVLLFEQKKYKEAEELLISSPSTQAEFKVRAHYLLGLVYKNTNRIDQAIGELELANSLLEVWAYEKEDPHFFTFSFRIPILRDLSELYSSKGNDKKARELLRKGVDFALDFAGRSDMEYLKEHSDIMIYE